MRRSDQRNERRPADPLVIGWSEYVAFPDWGIVGVRAKIDTGAKTSALHVENLEPTGHRRVCFDALSIRAGSRCRVRVECPVTREGAVRSSSGHAAARCFTQVRIEIGSMERTIELGLVDRGHMMYRMLLGRAALVGVLVDPTRTRLMGRQ